MAKLQWLEEGKRFYENGVSNGVLFVLDPETNKYREGVAWNGLVSVKQTPEGGEANDKFADNIKYVSLYTNETFKASIEAYTYPNEFEECDGYKSLANGLLIGQQTRSSFALAYLTNIGNDVNENVGQKLHIIYNAKAAPSERSYETINDSPELITFSWELSTIPVLVDGYKSTSYVELDSTKMSKDKWTALLDKIHGSASAGATLPTIAELKTLVGSSASSVPGRG